MKKERKPFYKKWWFWLIVAVVILAFIVPEDEEVKEATDQEIEEVEETNDNEEEGQDNEPDDETETEVEEDKAEEKSEEDKVEEGKRTIEVKKEIEFDNLNINLENVYVEDGTLRLGFWWNHWKSNDKVHFSVFAYPVVKQNGKELEYEDKNNTLTRKTAKGVDSRVDLDYKLIDDSPVEITFKTTTDDPEEENIIVEIK